MNLINKLSGMFKKSFGGLSILGSSAWYTGPSARPTVANMDQYLGRYADQAWVYACISLIQAKAASVPLRVYRRVEDTIEELPGHPLQILIEEANDYMDGYRLMEATHGFVELAGNAYWLLDNFIGGKPTEIYPLNPARIRIKADPKKFVVGYEYHVNGKVMANFTIDEILHFKTWNPLDDFYGLAPLSAARDSIDSLMYSDRYNRAFFENSAEPGGFLSSDGRIAEPERRSIADAWKKMHSGVRKAHRIAVLEGGMKWTSTAVSHRDMQFPELKKMTREDVLAVFRIPPAMVGVFGQDGSTRATSEEQRRIFWVDSMIPRFRRIESVLNEWLVKPYDKNLVIKHDLRGIEELKKDDMMAAQIDQVLTQSGIITINEARNNRNLEPVEWGDTWNAPMGIMPITEERFGGGWEPNDEDTPDEERSALPQSAAIALIPKTSAPPPAIVDKGQIFRDAIWSRFKASSEQMERRWRAPLRRLFSEQEKEVMRNLQDQNFEGIARQARLDKFKNLKQSIGVLLFDRAGWQKLFRKEGERLIRYTLAAAAAEEINEWNLGISYDITRPETAAWINDKAFKFAEQLNLTTEEKLRDALETAIREGETIRDVEKRLEHVFDIARGSRTEMIARTEVVGAKNKGAFDAYKQAGLEEKMWITSRDASVRDTHQIDGEVKNFSVPFSNGLMHPGDPTGDAGEVVNCFLPGTRVSGRFVGGLKSFYAGEAVEIQTRSGNRVSVTVNHPILTTRGFVAAGSLNKGDAVIGEDVHVYGRSPWRNENDKQTESAVENVFHAISADRRSSTDHVQPRPLDLHGDAQFIRGQVERVVLLGSLSDFLSGVQTVLVNERESPLDEFLRKLEFVRANASAPSSISRSFGLQLSSNFLGGYRPSARSGTSGGGLRHANVRRGKTPLNRLGFAPIPARDAALAKNPIDDLTGTAVIGGDSIDAGSVLKRVDDIRFGILWNNALRFGKGANMNVRLSQNADDNLVSDAMLAGQLLSRFPGLVSVDDIVNVRRFEYSGHVYDLQSPVGYLMAGGITSRNCRCTLAPYIRR